MSDDERFMSIALRLAHRGLGKVSPNPAVGCVIVRDGVVLGRGLTAIAGRPHAEIVALNNAGSGAARSTVYLTLEPCCHYGVTGPCTSALIEAGVNTVVIATNDPDSRVSGKGVTTLMHAGIKVRCGVMCEQAEALNAGFFLSKTKHRPFIAVKLATTLDGKITFCKGGNRWITNELTRRWVHKQRSMYDAIMVGSNTVVADDPMLDCRLPGLEQYSPVRIVVDRSGKLNRSHKLAVTAHTIPTYVVTDNDDHKVLDNVQYIKVEGGDSFLKNTMEALTAQLGITRLFVEGGGILVTELLKRKLVDKFIWCRADKVCGSGGVDSVLNSGDCCHFTKVETLSLMGDTVDIFNVTFYE